MPPPFVGVDVWTGDLVVGVGRRAKPGSPRFGCSTVTLALEFVRDGDVAGAYWRALAEHMRRLETC